jgi:Acyl-CoA synthetases (AMP-forming)/AMP-acid ligases II
VTGTVEALRAPVSRVEADIEARWRMRGFHTDERLGWMLEDRATATPERVATITSTRTVTYDALQEQSSAVARTLIAAGVQPGEVVCWMLPTDADAIAVASAIWRIGAVSSPIVPIYGVHEVAGVVAQVRPAAVITNAHGRVGSDGRARALADEIDEALATAQHRPRARLLVDGAVAGWRSATAEGPGALPGAVTPSAPEDPCLVLFTSGTESAPKGAVHTTRGIAHELRSCITEWGVTFRDRMFMASPMTHITGLLQGFLIPTRAGGASVLMDRWSGAEAVDLIERTQATYMAGATPFLRELLQSYAANGSHRSSLVQYCCGGAAVPPELVRSADELGIAAYRAWGMTELSTSTLPSERDPLDARAETDGPLAPGVELRVVGDDGEELDPGEIGALQLRGPEMFVGYLDETANERCFRPGGWFDTGDVGMLGADGYVRISGRSKEIINRGGEKFSVREIEELVARHPDVDAVAVVPVPGGRLGERIGAVIVSRNPSLTAADIGAFITGLGAARQKQPEEVVLVDAIPMNSTGKVDKRSALALFAGSV